YEEQSTVTGLWSLDSGTGDLFMINHTPSGAFSPLIDKAGRIIFVRWDHLQRDQQADTDYESGTITYGAFNWSDESPASVPTTTRRRCFPNRVGSGRTCYPGPGWRDIRSTNFFPGRSTRTVRRKKPSTTLVATRSVGAMRTQPTRTILTSRIFIISEI